MGGNLSLGRQYSKFLALQIKAIEAGLNQRNITNGNSSNGNGVNGNSVNGNGANGNGHLPLL
jgi:hypothetical protein